jgi:hypothetical protein
MCPASHHSMQYTACNTQHAIHSMHGATCGGARSHLRRSAELGKTCGGTCGASVKLAEALVALIVLAGALAVVGLIEIGTAIWSDDERNRE